ncbi:beta strand repeat-containing protein [Sulfobacillus harzensis]|uniref:Big-1 domain-containing protein n=1 Tax=Sulfobacillus harzensis TaxID=2729629 RepID=A0A7Y0Q3F0_9FIRM|nr:hypothetical protein [Sulfobacillus harzensis]NMP22906.1 hypothetical protein [Sulfobacillus harzensis]
MDLTVKAGAPATVKLSAASSSLVADGQATDTITATVVDANGNTVANFNGSAKVIIPTAGGTWTNGTPNGTNDWVWVNFTNGVGTATLDAPANNPNTTETINSAELMSGANGTGAAVSPIAYGNTDLSYGTPSATSISLTPTLANVSNNSATEDPVSVSINDQADQAMTTGSPVYVTFTITGPGSFVDGSSETTLSRYVTPGSNYTLPVYSVQGVSGTIQVSASAAGLTSMPISIGSVETTPASAFKLTSQQETLSSSMVVDGTTLPAGTTYTVYTAQTVDANGIPVAAQDNLTLSDSTTANGGTEALYYYNYSAANGVGNQITGGALQTSATTGQAQFAVFNTSAMSSPATITVDDTTTNTSETAAYAFQVGSATQVQFTNAEASQSVEAGKTITYSVQLADAAGNPVSQANVPVDFYFNGNGAGATIDGGSYWAGSNPYVVDTNASGVASVTVSVPSGASGTFKLDASYNSQATAAEETNTVVQAGTYASAIGLNSLAGATAGNYPTAADNLSLPTSITSGQTLAGTMGVADVYAYALNSIGEVANAGDTLQVSTSNSNVLSITGATNGAATFTAGGALPTIRAEEAGSATLTITDLSNPSAPSVTTTIGVTGGTTPTQISTLNPAGELNTAYTFSTSGVVGPFTIETTDAGGNVVPNNAPVGLTAQQVLAAIGVTGATGIRTSAGGSDVSNITIGANQGAVQVWVDGATSGNATVPTEPLLSSLTPALESATGSGSSVSLTFDSAIKSATTADFTVSGDTVTKDSVNGQTVTLTLGSALPVGATVSLAAGAVTTGYSASNGAISNFAINGAPTSSGVSASGSMTTDGVAAVSGTPAVETIAVTGTESGTTAYTVTVDGTNVSVTPSASGESDSTAAADIASALSSNSTVAGKYSVASSGSDVTLTQKTASNTQPSVTSSGASADGLTLTPTLTTTGVAAVSGTDGVYTLTVNSGATATGSLTVTVKSGSNTLATKTVNVTAGDSAATVAGDIVSALSGSVSGWTVAQGTGSNTNTVTLTQNTASAATLSVTVTG